MNDRNGINDVKKLLIQTAEITRGRNDTQRVYRSFISYCALHLSACTDPVHHLERKKRLTALLKDYTSAEQAAFGQAFQELANTVSRNVQCGIYQDILGGVFLELGAANRGMKQDFTPESIARLLARLTYHSSPDISEQGYFTLTDPTCGSGILLLAAAERFQQLGLNPTEELVLQAVDLDATCAEMAFIQLSLYGIPAVVIRGDTLTVTEYERWYTPIYLWRKWVWRYPMPFGTRRSKSDEQLKMLEEPLYAKARYVDQLFRKR